MEELLVRLISTLLLLHSLDSKYCYSLDSNTALSLLTGTVSSAGWWNPLLVSLAPLQLWWVVVGKLALSSSEVLWSILPKCCFLFWWHLQVAEPILPYALAFAAGAMVFVVMDDIVPEANSWYVHSVHMFHPLISIPQCSNMQCWLVPMQCCAVLLFVCSGNGRLASFGSLIGFVVMMSLDVGLG